MSDEIRKIALEFFKDKFGILYNKQKELVERLDSLEKKVETLDLEKKLKIDYMLKMNQLVKNDKSHQALYDKLFKQIAELKEKLDSPKKIPISDDLMKRIMSHKSVPMDKSKYKTEKKGSGGEKDILGDDGVQLSHESSISHPNDSKLPEAKTEPEKEDNDPYWCVEPDCGISDCSECPFSPIVQYKKIKVLEQNYRELLKKYSECEDSTIHKSFYLGLLEKLKSGG